MESRTQGSRPKLRNKKVRGQGQEHSFRGQTLSRPRTGMLEAKAKDQGHRRECSPKKSLQESFSGDLQKRKTKRSSQIFRKVSGVFQQNFNGSKNSALIESRAGLFSRTWGFEAKDLTFEAKDFKMCPRGQGRPRGLHRWFHSSFIRVLTVIDYF